MCIRDRNDIRELQMAKAAIRAGVDILVKKAGITMDEVDNCYLAGGCGTKIDTVSYTDLDVYKRQGYGRR